MVEVPGMRMNLNSRITQSAAAELHTTDIKTRIYVYSTSHHRYTHIHLCYTALHTAERAELSSHPKEFFFPSQPGNAPVELLKDDKRLLSHSEALCKTRWAMLIPDTSSESPSSAMSESLGCFSTEAFCNAKTELGTPWPLSVANRGAMLLLMMDLRQVSASSSLLQRSSNSRSTVRTLMQNGNPV